MVFARLTKYLSDLFHIERVGTATKRIQLYKLYIIGEFGYLHSSVYHAVRVRPLRDHIQSLESVAEQMEQSVFRVRFFACVRV